MGKAIFFIGLFISIVGMLLWCFSDLFRWFGNLPGDVKIEKDNYKIYFPITSMLILSLLLSLGVYLIKRFF